MIDKYTYVNYYNIINIYQQRYFKICVSIFNESQNGIILFSAKI